MVCRTNASRLVDLGPFKLLDVSAVRDQSGAINVAVVNRHLDRDIETKLDVAGVSGGVAYELNAPTVQCSNWFDAPNEVQVVERPVTSLTYSFPAHSLTLLTLRR